MIQESLNRIWKQLPPEVQLVAVSKFHGIPALMEAYDAGQRVFAESRPQELAAKVPLMPKDVQWHFIGHLQTNKLKLVLPHVSLVQSVDSLHLLQAISDWGVVNGRVIDVLLELHLGAEETKQGFSEQEILSICHSERSEESLSGMVDFSRTPFASLRSLPTRRALQSPATGPSPLSALGWAEVREKQRIPPSDNCAVGGVRIRGLMGMATNTDDMAVVEADFACIEALFRRIQGLGLPGFDQLSIGMSGDWPLAVRHGATMVRIGTDIFGPREY